jgi:hypothetical protein
MLWGSFRCVLKCRDSQAGSLLLLQTKAG